ncbi:autophagy protein [Elasticomyces elasticus]|nr:autophagy protein [Elasticomyces elasticus]
MVLAVRLNRKRLVVVLEDAMYLYDISTMKSLHTVETPSNPYAYPLRKKAQQPAHAPPTHAPPNSSNNAAMSGDVLIFDADKLEEVNVIQAHKAPLSCVALNNESTLLATASEKGTIIRVFSVPAAQKIHEFRRGSMPARIYSMSINATSTLLCCTSGTETIHIFKLSSRTGGSGTSDGGADDAMARNRSTSDARERSMSPDSESLGDSAQSDRLSSLPMGARQPKQSGWMSMVRRTSQTVSGNLVARAASYLPTAVTEIWEPERDFAFVKIPRAPNTTSSRCVAAMSANVPQIMVATNDGGFFVFNIDLENGGEGTLLRQFT